MTSSKNPGKVLGLFSRRERWGLSLRGWLVGILGVMLAGLIWVLNIHPFLSPTQRMDTKILVMEGWVSRSTIRAAIAEFQSGHYEKIYTTGVPVPGTVGPDGGPDTMAGFGADLLVKAGMSKELVQVVPAHSLGRDRTYNSALALREYFRTNGLAGKNFNVLTEDAHARRTWLLFQEAFGRKAVVGIIAVPDRNTTRFTGGVTARACGKFSAKASRIFTQNSSSGRQMQSRKIETMLRSAFWFCF